MRDLRIEIVDGGAGLYIAVDPDGVWGRSSEVDETITLDWDTQGRIIGLELAGATARSAVMGLAEALDATDVADRDALRDALRAIGLGPKKNERAGGSNAKRRASGVQAARKAGADSRTEAKAQKGPARSRT